MYLSKLRIQGFKSFANKVEVNFPGEGITSVVGPNGCGKSNIIDAIRWVLGEQKAKALRSSKMEDVIFSGTADKPAMGLAEVSLLINNDAGLLPSEYSQIMITRRAFRTGDTEYLINNQTCRLKDIHNLFYDTGMGAASYSLIEAKMIDSILSDKAEERRTMFEEASGISKYKQQRKETLRQLERTAIDLARVEDNFRHIQQNVTLFEKQARKAERWRELKKAYVSLELSHQSDVYREMRENFESFHKESETRGRLSGDLQSKAATLETALEEKRLGLTGEEQELSRLNQVVATTNAELVRVENESERQRDRLEHLSQSVERLGREEVEIARRLEEFAAEKDKAVRELEKLQVDRESLSRIASGGEEERLKVAEAVKEKRQEAAELSEERLSMLEELSGYRNRLSALQSEDTHLSRQAEDLENLLETGASRREELDPEKDRLAAEAARAQEESRGLSEKVQETGERILEVTEGLEAVRRKRREVENEQVALSTRLKMLRHLQQSMEGIGGGAQFLLERKKEMLRGLLAQSLEVDPDSMGLLEKALGPQLQTALLESGRDLPGLLQALREAHKGEALLFPLSGEALLFPLSGEALLFPLSGEALLSSPPGEAPADSVSAPAARPFIRSRPALQGLPGSRGWLLERVRVKPQAVPGGEAALQGLLEALVGHIFIVDDRDAAHGILRAHPGLDLWALTAEGEMVHASGLVRGGAGKAGETGLLQRESQLREAEARLTEVEKELAALVQDFGRLEGESRALGSAMDTYRQGYGRAERLAQEARGKLAVLESTLSGLLRDREAAESKNRQVRERLLELSREKSDLEERIAEGEEARKGVENRFLKAQDAVRAAEEERSRFEDWSRNHEREIARNDSQVKSLKSRMEYLDRSAREQTDLRARQEVQREDFESAMKQHRERIAELEKEAEALFDRLGGEEKERDAAKAAYDAKAVHLEELRLQIRAVHDDLRETTKAAHDAELKREQARTVMKNIRERMFELHEVDLDKDEEDWNFERVAYDLATVDEEVRQLKDKLKGLGNINTGALEDYENEKKRLEEVKQQFDDLETARAGLEKAIKKLDKVAREQFLSTFEVVRKNFQEVFSSLFEGGEAQLALEENADPLDARIEINARPTGKKMRGVSLLSGGERALTAISLLFALYLVRPSPYCIMDEVDGPLDDANIGRFVNLLRRFSHQTQFIVVTHNKRTMAASDMLYGVTQEVKGISKLVSVQLDEASRIAA